MEYNQEFNRGRHCKFSLIAHLVLLPKYRRPVFSDGLLLDLELVFKRVAEKFEAEILEFNAEKDHVHAMISYPPKHSLSKIINSLKGVSSRHLRKSWAKEIRPYLWGEHFWSPSYFVSSCGGVTIEELRKYVQKQDRPE